MPASPRGKYTSLQRFLAATAGETVTLTFAEIAAVVGAPLPATAHYQRAWWANSRGIGQSQARAWQAAGWRVADVNFGLRTVTFVRVSAAPPA